MTGPIILPCALIPSDFNPPPLEETSDAECFYLDPDETGEVDCICTSRRLTSGEGTRDILEPQEDDAIEAEEANLQKPEIPLSTMQALQSRV